MNELTRRESLRLYADAIQDMDAYALSSFLPVEALRRVVQKRADAEMVRWLLEDHPAEAYDAMLGAFGYPGKVYEDLKTYNTTSVEGIWERRAFGESNSFVMPSLTSMLGKLGLVLVHKDGAYRLKEADGHEVGAFTTVQALCGTIATLYTAAVAE